MQTVDRSFSLFQIRQPTFGGHSRSAFVTAYIVFVLLNLGFYLIDCHYILSAKMRNAVNFDFPGLSSIGTTRLEKTQHKLILLGSSLTIYPIWDLDRTLGAHCSDPNHYHSATCMEEKLKAKTSSVWTVCNLGSGGAMISDYFLLLSNHTKQTKTKPEWVVVDCAPRSFYDSGVSAANLTPIFDFFYSDVDLLSSSKYFLPTMNAYLNFIVEHHCYLYKNRTWLVDSLIKWLNNFHIIKQNNSVLNTSSINPTDSERNNKMQLSLQEYNGRYFGISSTAIKTQLKFLELIAQLCREKRIKLVIVNMPLTAGNHNLLKKDFYRDYLICLREIAYHKEQNVFFVDLDNSEKFQLSDFNDSVHLNAKGAVKLENEIIDFISNAATP
jgi:hypothetical protein